MAILIFAIYFENKIFSNHKIYKGNRMKEKSVLNLISEYLK